MRIPKYLSPSSLHKFEDDRREFYLKYCATDKPPYLPQTHQMAVGSAFDAKVKSYLHWTIFGNYGKDDEYHPDKIFEMQVEEPQREKARPAGDHVFDCYKRAGCLADLMMELKTCVGQPRFEFSIEDFIETSVGNIPLLGKPDIYFTNNEGARVILDWKVNGYYSQDSVSPRPGYVRVRDTWSLSEHKASRHCGPHKDAVVMRYKGVMINAASYLENTDAEWADQLAIYAWLLGEPIGSEEMITGIDQIVGCGRMDSIPPRLRVANHRLRISAGFQNQLLERLSYCWTCITSGHFFTDVSLEESQARCVELDRIAAALSDKDDPMAAYVNECSRKS